MSKDINPLSNEIIPVTTNIKKYHVTKRTQKLLYLSKNHPPPKVYGIGFIATANNNYTNRKIIDPNSFEPSTIYVKQTVRKPKTINTVPSPDYYPSYVKLTPEQKWIYLTWLRDVSQPIHIGYVFLYYYGLERHLLIGEFDLAIDEIIYLRTHHNNSSFIFYSSGALLYACLLQKRVDRLKDIVPLIDWSRSKNIRLLVTYWQRLPLTSKNLIELSRDIHGVNQRYIDNYPDLYEKILQEILITKYGEPVFLLLSKYKLNELPQRHEIMFANISFPTNVRSPYIPDFFNYQPFVTELRVIFNQTHEKVKQLLKEQRKSNYKI